MLVGLIRPTSGTATVAGHTAVHVAIVGARNANHIDDAIAAARLTLDADAMRRIDEIVAAEVPVGGPSPEAM